MVAIKIFLSLALVYLCSAAELKCRTCMDSEDPGCDVSEVISCSEQTVKAISNFCPGFIDRAMVGLPFTCLNVYYNPDQYTLRRYQGCFHRFNDGSDMCTVLKEVCPQHIICRNGTVSTQVSHHQKQAPYWIKIN
ncbi:uncharacterized protein LOC123674541 [Harmonia axyridis]|uniref:uncharacterized protein LOC123674541 n=1 Tax=Harmonia axyridis TaxID=115357 RepID=UPI001E2755F1|nr:uncharacterized protein LOC123674541 [Harmonia axyridis]